MERDELETLLIRTIALKEVLRHLIIKSARNSGADPAKWVSDLHGEIEAARSLALGVRADPEHLRMAEDVRGEVRKLFNEISL